eukprot:TRINITY_DN19585_c1_g2_i1.p1 TRINITY_DN19585_c1_g2~~TRINITY_DN19585_c1_g2_i1.p1  ORF type:complete len:292 (-),score=34.26 TRINITY_DN19585_c1_g2_i1:144-974(-)
MALRSPTVVFSATDAVEPWSPPKLNVGPKIPQYYRHWGGKHRGKSAVGVGPFEATKQRYMEACPVRNRVLRDGSMSARAPFLMRRPLSEESEGLSTPPPIGEDWLEAMDSMPRVRRDMQADDMNLFGGVPASARLTSGESLKRSPLPLSARAGRGSSGQGHRLSQPVPLTRASQSEETSTHKALGILPLPFSQQPCFGYGSPAVQKSVPPAVAADPIPEAPDLTPQERFLSSYGSFYKAHQVKPFKNPDMPPRFKPAECRSRKELALNCAGRHLER